MTIEESKVQSSTTQRQCIVLMCDDGYLFPSSVCAKQARAHAPESADVVIFIETKELTDERKHILESTTGAMVRVVPDWLIEKLDRSVPEGFFQTHVNRAALFRLFVGHILDKSYERIVYLDGDIQVRRSLEPLLTLALPQGKVGVVPDWVALHSEEGWPHVEANRAYMDKLSFLPEHWSSYFNSGVMVASPDTWNDIGPKALDFLIAKPEACRLHDQSALNHVCRGRTTLLSLRWNFLRQYMPLPAYKTVDPAILHFVGRLKPWDGAYYPWTQAEFQPYLEMAAALKGTGVKWNRQSASRRLAYHFKPLLRRNEYADPAYRQAMNEAIIAECRTHP